MDEACLIQRAFHKADEFVQESIFRALDLFELLGDQNLKFGPDFSEVVLLWQCCAFDRLAFLGGESRNDLNSLLSVVNRLLAVLPKLARFIFCKDRRLPVLAEHRFNVGINGLLRL